MTVTEFIDARRARWEELEALLRRADRRLRSLTTAEIDQLGTLYRLTASDLAAARRDHPDERVVLHLNDLVGRAHGLVYRHSGEDREPWRRRLASFVLRGYPALFRKHGRYTATAFGIVAVSAVLAYLVAVLDPGFYEGVLPQETLDRVERAGQWAEIDLGERAPFSSLIMTNNIQVSFLAFAGGLALGLVTVYVLLVNGLMLGAIIGLCRNHGIEEHLFAFVSSHGYIELTIIFVAGGAGLRMGHDLLRPGPHRRLDALRRAAGEAVQLVLGSAPLLVVAGLIEGFISPSPEIPHGFKYVFGPVTAVLLFSWLLLSPPPAPKTAPGPARPG
jgi:uncharacterized membrane protein SpoIIM required for sporulation